MQDRHVRSSAVDIELSHPMPPRKMETMTDLSRCFNLCGSGQCGRMSPRVSRPSAMATIDSAAKQVITAVALAKSPPNGAASNPATNGPKLVITRPDPLQNDTAAA